MPMTADQIRELFLRYFAERGHTVVPSSSLLPQADPTLLFVNAGMVQFKDVFTGAEKRPYTRAASSQKCLRVSGKHNDLDEVGRTARHHTLFEMLGNFSFGDYFKREAIGYAWEFLTQRLHLPKEQLWCTVYRDDDEAFRLWQEVAGVGPGRIVRLGEKDNFWSMGETGPCGPCSEIIYDRGEEHRCGAPVCAIGECDCDRWLELWNLVFMQYDRNAEGVMTPLPRPSIDTGMGLERISSVVHGVPSNYDTDLLRPLIQEVERLSGRPYYEDERGFPFRVIADHARACAFLVADGIIPGNEGRGYVLRRILRRAVRFGRKLGLSDGFFAKVAGVVIERMGEAYSELVHNRDFILRVIGLEETRFDQTLTAGLELLENEVIATYKQLNEIVTEWCKSVDSILKQESFRGWEDQLWSENDLVHEKLTDLSKDRFVLSEIIRRIIKSQEEAGTAINEVLRSGKTTASPDLALLRSEITKHVNQVRDYVKDATERVRGIDVFFLHDTYGFPMELTQEIAAEHSLGIDLPGFRREMEQQRERARAAQKAGVETDTAVYEQLAVTETVFLGYETTEAKSVVIGLLVEGEPHENAGAGQQVEVVLRETPFYAEMGGQVADIGEIAGPRGRVEVTHTFSPLNGLSVHRGHVAEGEIADGDAVTARVDVERRADIMRNHTATHLLHAALRKLLGLHVRQHGSLVAPDRFRFDFSHIAALTPDEIRAIEGLVNEKVRENLPVRTLVLSYTEAIATGAVAFFDEKYGERVRVVRVEEDERPFSAELCGGTHVSRTGDIGYFHIVTESSIGAGMRRIESVTGRGAEAFVAEHLAALEAAAREIQAAPRELPARVTALRQELTAAQRRIADLEREMARRQAEALLSKVATADGVRYIAAKVDVGSMEALREMGDFLKAKLGSGVVVLGATWDNRPSFLAAITEDLVKRGLHSGRMVKEVAAITGGGGGGRADLGQAGGKDASKLDEALALVPVLLRI